MKSINNNNNDDLTENFNDDYQYEIKNFESDKELNDYDSEYGYDKEYESKIL